MAEAARTAGVPVNVTDRAELSSFIVPAIVERDPVVIGISTGGAAPVLASRVRESIERLLPARLGRLAEFASSFRRGVRSKLPQAANRFRFWDHFFDGPIAAQLLAGDEHGRAGAHADPGEWPRGDRGAERLGRHRRRRPRRCRTC